ncbi:RNA-guided endonuclease TnpB family protein [Clostridium botulinum]|uniref:RNA-guided endonuclease TnpB family protein n=1 Tax=Clostridium botulinum TaxID=1491 RepID=UPI001C9AA56A|nr:RNA-guided endonuclease TnpB family protein [Clostridium botulinum]MBY6838858.1 IS200/IS605 family element transposase accessory protein TnpB [Clostridium botulinum]
MGTIVKTVKQYSYELNAEALEELKFIANQYKNVKNYVYSRYSGINSIPLLSKERQIRNEWTKSKFYEQWKLPARYWKLALTEAMGNIKSQWSNIKRRIKEQVKVNENLPDEDEHYINYIVKFNDCYHKVLNHIDFDIPKIFKNKNLNFKYLNNLIRRYTRKYKGHIPYSKIGRTFSVDAGLYSYKNNCINITSTKKGKRLSIKLTDNNRYDRTMIVKIIDNKIVINCSLKIKARKNKNSNIIGIDKGYRYLFAVSSNRVYGENLNNYLSKETERLNKINAQRNRFWALYNQYLDEGDIKKANKIKENNLGKVKYNYNKLKHDQTVKSYINYSLNQLIKEEKPKEIVMEQLDFVNWNDKYPKNIKRKLSRWIKGYIRERLEYKCDFYSIKYTYINPAYTSKVCSTCGGFGKRDGDSFICPKCGEFHADINASKNILNRKYDKDITLYTNYKKVKKILENRVKVS